MASLPLSYLVPSNEKCGLNASTLFTASTSIEFVAATTGASVIILLNIALPAATAGVLLYSDNCVYHTSLFGPTPANSIPPKSNLL